MDTSLSALHWNLQSCRMESPYSAPTGVPTVGREQWAGLRERAPIFAFQVPLSQFINDQQPDTTVFYA